MLDYRSAVFALRSLVLPPAVPSSVLLYAPISEWRRGREEGQPHLKLQKVWRGAFYVRRGQMPMADSAGWKWGRAARLQSPWRDSRKIKEGSDIHRYRVWDVNDFAESLTDLPDAQKVTDALVDLLVFVAEHRQARLYIKAEFVEPGDITE